jgi:hypothetical protein
MAEKAIGGFDGKIGMTPQISDDAFMTDEEIIKTTILYMTDMTGSSEENTSSESPVLRDKNKLRCIQTDLAGGFDDCVSFLPNPFCFRGFNKGSVTGRDCPNLSSIAIPESRKPKHGPIAEKEGIPLIRKPFSVIDGFMEESDR